MSIVIFSYPQPSFLRLLSCCVQCIVVDLVWLYNYHHNNYDSKLVATHYLLLKLWPDFSTKIIYCLSPYVSTNRSHFIEHALPLNNKRISSSGLISLFPLVLVSYLCRKYGILAWQYFCCYLKLNSTEKKPHNNKFKTSHYASLYFLHNLANLSRMQLSQQTKLINLLLCILLNGLQVLILISLVQSHTNFLLIINKSFYPFCFLCMGLYTNPIHLSSVNLHFVFFHTPYATQSFALLSW